ncbi:MAG TPA: winged helix-turn-helix domain-containing protein [Candidatus Nanoarchaeia archaeon]|nr:winged helix-turn-helix domain-containing protein [Candidatus Nanoarchaeia archaeon]
MIELDQQEEKIVRELIRNPRISDNQISKRTRIPVMTVNRKRKNLENKNLLTYYTNLDSGETGTGMFNAKQLYIIKFKIGITHEQYFKNVTLDSKFRGFKATYVSLSYLGEKDGHLALIMIVDARSESKLVDEFNGKLIPYFKERLGEDCIRQVITAKITQTVRTQHNYLPKFNMEKGRIRDDWLDDWIFVGKEIEKA